MALKLKLGGSTMPNMTSKDFEKYCQKIQDVLWDDTKVLQSFIEVCILLDEVLNEDYDSNYDRASAKTLRLVKALTTKVN